MAWVEEHIEIDAADQVLVQTVLGAISVGTELPFYKGTHRGTLPITYPRMTGYESLGRVLARGPAVIGFKPGDRVVTFYGHRTHAVVAEAKLLKVPPETPGPIALLAILGCDTLKGINSVAVQTDERVLITGAGTIGLLTLFNLKARGVNHVDVVEPASQRRALARQWGASTVWAPDDSRLAGPAYEIGFECSSRNGAFGLLQRMLCHRGRLCVLADGNIEPLVLHPHFHEKELRLFGSSDGDGYADYADWFYKLVGEGPTPLGQLYELETEAAELAETFAHMVRMTMPPIKVLVRYAISD